jgi:PAS domain-containing protein
LAPGAFSFLLDNAIFPMKPQRIWRQIHNERGKHRVTLLDKEGKIVYVNSAALKLMGVDDPNN